MKNETVKTVIRWVVMTVLLINSILVAKGINPIPFDETAFTEWAAYTASGLMALWAAWKDSPLTKAGRDGHALTKAIKEDGLDLENLGGDIDWGNN